MFNDLVHEDAYWERRWMERENPRRLPGYEPEPERDWLFIDEEIDDIEAENGCTMEELGEDDLFVILDKMVKHKEDWLSAKWDRSMWGIEYTYKAA